MSAIIYEAEELHASGAFLDTPPVPTVLVVDDEKAMLAMVRDILEDEGFRVLTACEGYEALRIARRRCPDLILTDLMMPNLDGRGLRQMLKTLPLTSDIPVILMTTAYREQVDDHFAAVIEKPFQIDHLIDCVTRFGPS